MGEQKDDTETDLIELIVPGGNGPFLVGAPASGSVRLIAFQQRPPAGAYWDRNVADPINLYYTFTCDDPGSGNKLLRGRADGSVGLGAPGDPCTVWKATPIHDRPPATTYVLQCMGLSSDRVCLRGDPGGLTVSLSTVNVDRYSGCRWDFLPIG